MGVVKHPTNESAQVRGPCSDGKPEHGPSMQPVDLPSHFVVQEKLPPGHKEAGQKTPRPITKVYASPLNGQLLLEVSGPLCHQDEKYVGGEAEEVTMSNVWRCVKSPCPCCWCGSESRGIYLPLNEKDYTPYHSRPVEPIGMSAPDPGRSCSHGQVQSYTSTLVPHPLQEAKSSSK